jgi:uncharacterized metal-binding protein YceD (DUF177 family)
LLYTAVLRTFAHPKKPVMNHRREFEIAFVGLKPGVHVYEYRLDDKFFATYEGEKDFANCQANIKLSLEKNNSFMQLKFDVGGNAEVLCDRCGNTLPITLWDEFNLVVKMVDEPELMNTQEEDPDVFYISRGESHLHLANWLYEFVTLSIPLQNNCSEDEQGNSLCNKEVLAKLKQMEEQVKAAEQGTNPLWKGLEKFKDLD